MMKSFRLSKYAVFLLALCLMLSPVFAARAEADDAPSFDVIVTDTPSGGGDSPDTPSGGGDSPDTPSGGGDSPDIPSEGGNMEPGSSGNEDSKPSQPSTGGNDTLIAMNGTADVVPSGTWQQDANGVWHYVDSTAFRNTWGYIVNPHAKEARMTADWFWFDRNGNMLTGWQYINGKWYYNPSKDGILGAFQRGGVTPDGYKVDENGAWIAGIPQK